MCSRGLHTAEVTGSNPVSPTPRPVTPAGELAFTLGFQKYQIGEDRSRLVEAENSDGIEASFGFSLI